MRTYSEAEVSAIISRAVERQQDADAGAAESGLTLDEIERVGRESGIDPAHLRAAASEIDTAGRTLDRQTGQTKTEVVVERWIDAPLRVEAWEDVVGHLREHFGPAAGWITTDATGETVRQVGSTYEWTHTSGAGVRTRVSVSPRDGRTRLRMTRVVGSASPKVEGAGYGAFLAAIPALATGAGLDALGLEGAVLVLATVLAFLAWWAAAATAGAALDRRWRANKLRDLDALADDLTPVLNRASTAAGEAPDLEAAAPASAPETERAPRTDLEAPGGRDLEGGPIADVGPPLLDLDAPADLEAERAPRRGRVRS